MRRLALLPALAFLLAACDSDGVVPGGAVYRTDGTDYPNAVTRLAEGGLAVGVLTEGTIAPADGTIGFPGVVRFDAGGELESAEVYRADERDFSGVEGVAPLGRGLAVAVVEDERAVVYETDGRGRRRGVLFRTETAAYLPSNALVATPGGLVLRVSPRTVADPHLYALDADGDVRWTYRLSEASLLAVVPAGSGGDLFVVGYGAEGGAVVARLSDTGAERWRRDVADAGTHVVAAVGEGLALAFDRIPTAPEGDTPDDDRVQEVRVARLDGEGRTVWARTVASASLADGGLRASALAGLADGGVALALVQGGGFEQGTWASVRLLAPDGGELRAVTVSDPDRASTFVTHLLAAPGRLTAVSAVGPERLGGYGGDDFDVVVSRVAL